MDDELTLAELPVGCSAFITEIEADAAERARLSQLGLTPGTGCQWNFRRRRAFVTTKSELHAMAAVPSIGESCHPNAGYSAPAAIGIPSTL